jgi:sn-glycerol 3-phosphate transport system permease protein
LREYARIQALTEGGPASSTTTLSFKIVEDGLQNGMPADASAQAAVLSVITVVLAIVILVYLRRRESSMQ